MGSRKQPSPAPGTPGYRGPKQYKPEPPPAPPARKDPGRELRDFGPPHDGYIHARPKPDPREYRGGDINRLPYGFPNVDRVYLRHQLRLTTNGRRWRIERKRLWWWVHAWYESFTTRHEAEHYLRLLTESDEPDPDAGTWTPDEDAG